MELLKKLFKDEDKVIGLCSIRKEYEEPIRVFIPKFTPTKTFSSTSYNKNFFLL